ncbi:MAG TPA: cytochrome c-type biogenesis protein CcmH, partial [Rhodospirillales bacterium]|nr:cytochrome c-type biogenesis protein CcmH [Rhodospirillales bacterium]
MKRLVLALILCLAAVNAVAVNPDEVLDDPVLEARAREISKGLRCLVCQNQSIDESGASLAKDLRILVRERLVAGDSNEQVIDYVVSRYGDFVLLKPRFKSYTLALWLGPVLIVGLGLLAVIIFFRRRTSAAAAPAPLSKAEKKRLKAL